MLIIDCAFWSITCSHVCSEVDPYLYCWHIFVNFSYKKNVVTMVVNTYASPCSSLHTYPCRLLIAFFDHLTYVDVVFYAHICFLSCWCRRVCHLLLIHYIVIAVVSLIVDMKCDFLHWLFVCSPCIKSLTLSSFYSFYFFKYYCWCVCELFYQLGYLVHVVGYKYRPCSLNTCM